MTDGAPGGGDQGRRPPAVPPIVRPPAVPPVVPPVARQPIVPPVAKPVVPPTVPPVARPVPVAPPVKPVVPPAIPVAPVAKPVVPPVVPVAPAKPLVPPLVAPVAKPVASPVVPVAKPVAPVPVVPVAKPIVPPAAPVAAAPPVVRPAVAPALAPVARPVASAPASARERGRDEPSPRRAREGRETGARHGPPPKGGMSLGAKVGLLSALLTAGVIALAVLPGRKAAAGGDADPTFDAVGSKAAAALAAGIDPTTLAPKRSSESSEAVKAVQALLEDAKKDIERYGGDDQDELARLRQRREGLIKILDAVTPAAGAAAGTRRLYGLGDDSGYEVVAARVVDPAGRVVAERDPNVAIDVRQSPPGYESYPATVAGREVHVFEAPVLDASNRSVGRALVALAPRGGPAGGGGGGALPLAMLIVGPLLVGGLAYVVASGHQRPLRDLARELDKVGSTGDPKRRINAHGPEASAIARSVERMVANLEFRSQHEGSDLSDAIAKEQEAAAEVHQGLMPKTSPRIPGYEVETLFKPGFEIGGDHFEYFQIDDRHLGVILLDTSVRGIRAALVMSMARAYVRTLAPGVLSPSELLTEVNKLLAVDLSPGQYVTALYVVIDTESGSARVASAGHLPLIVYRHAIGKTAIVNPEGIALGLDVGPVFERSIEEVEVPIGVGDRLVLHTDGALKVQNEVGEEFGEPRLYDSVKKEAPKNSQAFVNFVGSAIDAFHVGTPQNDDITISTVKRLK